MEVLTGTQGRPLRGRRRGRSSLRLAVFVICCSTSLAASAAPRLQNAPAGVERLGLGEAIALALAHDPNVRLAESDLSAARGRLLSTRGDFDPILTGTLEQDRQTLPGGAETDDLRTVIGLDQLLRTGFVLSPQIELQRSDDGDPAALNQAVLSIDLRQPLMRGRGRGATAAGERSAERLVEAGRLDLEQVVSERLRTVVTRYWSSVAAWRDLEILRATEESTRRLLETTRRLVEADVTPAAELVLLEADLASRESDRIAGERSLYQARLDLALEIGLPPEEMAALPPPGDPFPDVAVAELPPMASAGELYELALRRRADLRAARWRLASSEALLAGAENALQPRLDLVFLPSYTGQVTGDDTGDFFRPLVNEIPGLSMEVGLNLSWPTLNRRAEGDLVQAHAAAEQRRLAISLTTREIAAEVPIALDAARRVAIQVEIAERAARLFEQAVINEEKKLRAGSSTLIDVISQRDRLTSSRRQLVSARLDLALALLELRFQTGTLVTPEADRHAVRVEDVLSFPTPSL